MADPLALTAALAAALVAVDGDTLRDPATGQRFRLAGIDAPERGHRAECLQEWILAEASTRRLAEIAAGGARLVYSGHVDHWNRPLVDLRTPEGATAADLLVAEGLAVRWEGAPHDWCG